jgi:GTP cyclohydrolase I
MENKKELNEYSRLDYNTPLRPDAFDLSDDEKIKKIETSFAEIMQTLGLDMTDDSLKGTPKRVAKMYVKEIFSGLDARNFPKASLFENKFGYKEMLVEKDITFYSNCEHHFVPFYGMAHVAYMGADKVIGLSKLNRIVQYFAKRPQVQERLTNQIGKELQIVLQTENVAVMLEANHLCVESRGIKDTNSKTITVFYGGKFISDDIKNQFLSYISV